MNKELANSLAEYVAQLTQVVTDISDSHYLNGNSNKAVRILKARSDTLIVQIHEAAKAPPVTFPPLPAPAPAPAA